MKILVTGATGFIGGNLVKRLKTEGWKVIPLVRKGNAGDLRNYDSMEKKLKGIDIVINCAAALPHHKLSTKEYWETNVGGVQNIVDASIKNKVKKLIHISSVAALDIKARDVYSITKRKGDQIIAKNKSMLKSVIIRPTIAYGPGDVRPVFLRLFRSIKMGLGITIGGGVSYLHTIYIDNLTDAIVLAVKKNFASAEDFIIGDESCPKMKGIISVIAKVMDKRYITVNVPKPIALMIGKIMGIERLVRFNSENQKYKIDKAKKILGYKPKIDLLEGMQETYKWYKRNNIL